jgi:PKD repeat protein
MQKLLFFFISIAFVFISAYGQNNTYCGSSEANKKFLEQNPELLKVREQLEVFTQEYIAANSGNNRRSGQIYIIPIVFHVVHNFGNEYISDEQIYDAVKILNEDFRKRNADTSEIVSSFQNIAADCEIEFRLATKDRFGNCTNGIDRIHSMLTYNASDAAKLNPWPRDMYLNIWLTNNIGRSGVAGYAYYPSGAQGMGAFVDGIIILSHYVGSIGTGSYRLARALTHEIGHYFNLAHPWGEGEIGSCGDDGVSDTPFSVGWSTCNLNGSICSPGIIENVQNYMEYAYCSRMFTEGQKLRMHAALNSSVSFRNVLWQEATLIKTGAINSTNGNTCSPIAEFKPQTRVVCVGESVSFQDFSWRGPITSHEWTFSNGTPSTSSSPNPTVVFNQPGWQKVALKVTNDFGTDVKTEEYSILVSEYNGTLMFETFEDDISDFNSKWAIENNGENASKFQLTGIAAYSGKQCIMLNNFDVKDYDVDVIITPPYDIKNDFNTNMTFKYSLATRATLPTQIEDRLRIFYSVNCGQTWIQFFSKSGFDLINAGNFKDYYIPSHEPNWSELSIQLPNAVLSSSNVYFKFEFTRNEYSNNFYIDNINVGDNYYYTGIENNSVENEFINVFPNPAKNSFVLEFENEDANDIMIQIFDIAGKEIFKVKEYFNKGVQQYLVSEKLSNGLYHIRLISNKKSYNRKIIIDTK